MHDAALVRRFERLGDLPRDGKRLGDWHWSAGQAFCQRRSFDELEHERRHAFGVFETVDRADVRMIQGRE